MNLKTAKTTRARSVVWWTDMPTADAHPPAAYFLNSSILHPTLNCLPKGPVAQSLLPLSSLPLRSAGNESDADIHMELVATRNVSRRQAERQDNRRVHLLLCHNSHSSHRSRAIPWPDDAARLATPPLIEPLART